ncbi:helix-turn-helix domain-containing protein [Anaerobacillus isosaccharinicus]|uniref:Helix-turn-helix domain-containing protein n=1 Tax=Anaerobacillus isosaccharinicus TaxID=1532552 RepID=A0A1S2ME06_9BACI|nr:helix-turn-helix domain-containing protein [Anaerobacillus isosaccharinicus]MBA5588577.1 helix-turn-helix domain-containing protein [Anaerobacillus isosaccharinicus]QOY38008.1 helix-turn-helix domain-containing protein [Anaerobacillus isosaccharinicus]
MDMYIGDKIKELRMHFNILQGELAKGICTQSTISRIEKNEIIPNAYILYRMAKRLGVGMDYFYESESLLKLDYVQNVRLELARLVRERNYKEVLKLVRMEKNNPLFRRDELMQILLWREGFCVYYLNNDPEKAFQILYDALNLTPTTEKNTSVIDIDILASIAAIHDEIGQFAKSAEIYRDISLKLKKLPANYDANLAIRVTYNSAVNAHYLANYQEAINFCNKTIELCRSNLTMYILGETYFQKGESLYALTKNKEEALFWMKKSIVIFELIKNEGAIKYVNDEMNKLVD